MSTAPALPTRKLTWDEFLALPDDSVYTHAYLIDGEIVLNPPTRLHQRIVGRLWAAIDQWAREEAGRGEVTMNPPVQVAVDRGYLPDLAWYPEDRCGPPDRTQDFDGTPALAVEVLSPSTRRLDLVRKRDDYPRAGVDELWLIDPEGPEALVLRRPAQGADFEQLADLDRDGELTSPLLAGFAVRLGDLTER